jgi:hypothetical protein
MPLPCRNALMETVTYGNRAGAHAADWALSNTTVEVPESTPLKFPLFGQESIRRLILSRGPEGQPVAPHHAAMSQQKFQCLLGSLRGGSFGLSPPGSSRNISTKPPTGPRL